MTIAPIVLFCYARPDHLARCLKALEGNELAGRSTIFIFCDGAKSADDLEAVRETRRIAHTASGFAEVHVRESAVNLGLARSISEGITEICERFGRVVVVEDDLVVSSTFLSFMNEGLDRYADEERVMQIGGFMFDVDLGEPPRSFFMRMTTSWGWATWQRAWRHFSNDPTKVDLSLLDEETTRRFDQDGCFPYTKMLRYRIEGKNQSWDILWMWNVFQAKGLVLLPTRSLVSNIGFDGSGTHFVKPPLPGEQPHPWMVTSYAGNLLLPDEVAVDEKAAETVRRYMFTSTQKKPKPPKTPKIKIKRKFFERLLDSVNKRLRRWGLMKKAK